MFWVEAVVGRHLRLFATGTSQTPGSGEKGSLFIFFFIKNSGQRGGGPKQKTVEQSILVIGEGGIKPKFKMQIQGGPLYPSSLLNNCVEPTMDSTQAPWQGE